jgi:RNA polymerase sigma-70 factor (ECF subfamily)
MNLELSGVMGGSLPRMASEACLDTQAANARRIRELVVLHSAFVWRTLVRFGVSEADAEDASQEVFWTLTRRIGDVLEGAEKGFLFRTAVGVASTRRRSRRRRPEAPLELIEHEQASGPLPDEVMAQRRLRALLARVLEELSAPHRAVFVLIEIEELSAPDVAELLELPLGTVASRLRRARRAFLKAVEKLELGEQLRGRDG